jgi:hypothetical protein
VTNSIVQQASIKQHGIAITVPSNLNIVPGNIVTIKIPTNQEYSTYIKHYGNDAKFLVTAVSNRLTKNGDYVTNLECVKESFGKDVSGNPVFTTNDEIVTTFRNLISEGLDFNFQDFEELPFGVDRVTGLLNDDLISNPQQLLSRFVPQGTTQLISSIQTLRNFRNFRLPGGG